MDLKVLAIVVPCYNEEEVLPSSNEQLISVLNNLIEANKISKDSYILYVDDEVKIEHGQLLVLFMKRVL